MRWRTSPSGAASSSAFRRKIRAQIDKSLRVAWLPLSIHVTLGDIMLEAFGSARAHDYYRRSFVRAVKGPVFGLRDGLDVGSLCSRSWA